MLEAGLESKSVSIQARAQVSLAKFGVAASGSLSTEDLLRSSNAEDRPAAVAVVQTKPWSEAKPLAMRLLADPDLRVRRAVVDSLSNLVEKEREGVRTLYKPLTKDADMVSRAKAQAQLAKLVEPLNETAAASVAPPVTPDSVPVAPAVSPQTLAAILKEARAAFKSTKTPVPGRVVYLEGLLFRAQGESSSDEERKSRFLRKAQESFLAYLRSGESQYGAETKKQLAEIGPLLTDLLMAPQEEVE